MYTNADITLYNKYFDEATRTDKYRRTIIKNVFFEEKLGANRIKSGLESSDAIMVLIPYASLKGYVAPKEYDGSTNTFTFALGDRIVKNQITMEISNRPSELDKHYSAFTISSVDNRGFGSEDMRHFEIGGR